MRQRGEKNQSISFSLLLLAFLFLTVSSCGGGGDSSKSSKKRNQPPSVPTSLTVSVNDYFLTAGLSCPSVDDVTVAGYKIYRNGNFLSYSDICRHVDTDLKLNTQYCYTVKAYDEEGSDSLPSNKVCIHTNETLISPVTALRAVAVSSTQVNLSWSLDPNTLEISGYSVYRAGNLIASTYSTSFSDRELSINTEYCYEVTATDPYGKESAPGNQACATTGQGGDIDVRGTWNGSLSRCQKPDNFTLTFYGNFQVLGSIGECIRDYIPLAGFYTINGNAVTFEVISTDPDICRGTIKGTGWVSTDNLNYMSGSISATDCLYFVGTSFNLKRIL
jgi:chitodextrinase